MSVTKLAVRRRVQNTQSICRECSSTRKKARTKIWFSICHSIMRQICSSLLWVRTTANCSILTVSQGRLKVRHIGIQCHFSHFTYPKTPKEDNKGLHIYPFVQTDYKQLKKPQQDRLKEEIFRIQWPEQVEFILNSCSVCFRRKPLEVQVRDTSGPNQAFLWKSAIRCSMSICNCVLCCWFKGWRIKFALEEEGTII